jgi:hypothetical protein
MYASNLTVRPRNNGYCKCAGTVGAGSEGVRGDVRSKDKRPHVEGDGRAIPR